MISSLKERRTIRKYLNKDIDEQLLNELLETAFRAPTTQNMQVYSVVITREQENKEKLAPAHFNQPTVTSAPVVLTFCADFNRFIKWCEQNHAEPGYDNFQSFVTAAIDALLVAQQFCTVAEISGLGCCYLGTTTYNAPQIAEILRLPKFVIPYHSYGGLSRRYTCANRTTSHRSDSSPRSISRLYPRSNTSALFRKREFGRKQEIYRREP